MKILKEVVVNLCKIFNVMLLFNMFFKEKRVIICYYKYILEIKLFYCDILFFG